MALQAAQPTQASLRKVLLRVLAERSQLDRLCVDYFISLCDKFNPNSSLDEAITTLFQYVEPQAILEAIKAEPDWAARLEKYQDILVYKVSIESRDLGASSGSAAEPTTGSNGEPGRAPSFRPKSAVPPGRPARARKASRATYGGPAPGDAPPSWAKFGLWLLLGAMALGGSAGAALSLLRSGPQPMGPGLPVEPAHHQPGSSSPAVNPNPPAPLTVAPTALPPEPLRLPSEPGRATEPPSKKIAKVPEKKPIERGNQKSNQKNALPYHPAVVAAPKSPPTPCESSACAQTGTYEYYDRLLKEGKTACKANSQATASSIYDRLAVDPDRQHELKDACKTSNVKFD